MNDRDHIDPLALAVLDEADAYRLREFSTGESTPLGREATKWLGCDKPLFTPRASAVLSAVEVVMRECDGCDYKDCEPCDSACSYQQLMKIRRAWRES